MRSEEGGVMDIQRKAFEESNNVKPDWSFKFDEDLQQYIALDHEMQLQVDEFNEHWDTFRAGWQAAKADAVPELTDKMIVAIEQTVENQLQASGINADPFRLDGEKIWYADIEAGEKK